MTVIGLDRGWAAFGRIVAMLAVALALAACANTRGGSVPYDRADFGRPDLATLAVAENGPIGPLDTLGISVFQLPDLNRDVIVDAGGNISLPLIGTVRAQGKTTQQLAQEIATALGQKYIRNPDVQVVTKQAMAQTVTVEGSVTSPGVYPIVGRTSLLKAVALAKGTNQDANPRRVVIFRTINGQRNAAAFDLTAIRRAEAPDPEVFGNDIVVVDGGSNSRFRDLIQVVPLLALFRPI